MCGISVGGGENEHTSILCSDLGKYFQAFIIKYDVSLSDSTFNVDVFSLNIFLRVFFLMESVRLYDGGGNRTGDHFLLVIKSCFEHEQI